jgi:hypothetical protein
MQIFFIAFRLYNLKAIDNNNNNNFKVKLGWIVKKKSETKKAPATHSPKKSQKATPPPDDPLGRFQGTEDRHETGNLSDEEQAKRRVKAIEEARKMPPSKD